MDENMNNSNKIEDQILKDLFNDFELEKAPESIKQNTMNQVFKDWTENEPAYKPIFSGNRKYWIIALAAATLIISLIVDNELLNSLFNELNSSSYIDLSLMGKNFGSIANALKSIPSLAYLIGIGGLALFSMDKLFNRLANI